jgi:hypothetical protein
MRSGTFAGSVVDRSDGKKHTKWGLQICFVQLALRYVPQKGVRIPKSALAHSADVFRSPRRVQLAVLLVILQHR